MAVFSEIPNLTDFQIMDCMKKVDDTTVAIALLGAPDEVITRIRQVLPDAIASRISEKMRELSKMSAQELIIESNRAIISAVLSQSRPGMR